ncbi:MAG TPA: GNAT family N-acetyltransferase [Pseudoneobacillus sp.]|nr:GNAT family N-acetyltransferase [Pseudoneobacillus sp.]
MNIYQTERLILKQLDENDAGKVLDYFNRNREFLEKWEAQRSEEFFTLDFQTESLKQDILSFQKGTSVKFWILKKEDQEKVIGCISFSVIVRGILQSCIMGYKLDESELKKGFITEAIKKAIEVMFNELGLHRIEAPIMPKNEASIQVVKKLGFTNEGISRKMIRVNGIWEDHIRWAIINESDKEL